MPKRKDHHPYFTDGKRLLRLEFEISQGRGVVMEDARFDEAEQPAPGQILSLSVKEFLELEKVKLRDRTENHTAVFESEMQKVKTHDAN